MALNLLSTHPPPFLQLSSSLPPSSSAVSAVSAVSVRTPPPEVPVSSLLLHPKSPPPPLRSSSFSLHCPHFELCSGCTQENDLQRPLILDEAVGFFEKLGVSNFTFSSCRLWGWRCRAKLVVRGSQKKPLIGLYQEGTHNVVDIPDCKAHHPSINAAVELLKQGIIELNIEPYDEDKGIGELRYVQMAVTTHDTSLPASERYEHGKVQVTLVWNSTSENAPSSAKLKALANFLWRYGCHRSKFPLVHSVWANFQTATDNVIFGIRWKHLLGERDFWEHVGGIDVSLAPSSFGQANTQAFDSLLRKVQKHVPLGASVADLYAGAGVIGLSLAATRKCKSVTCVEVNKESKLSFEKTVERLPSNIASNISWRYGDMSIEPLSWLVGSDVVIVDPPRKGLHPSLIDAFRKISSPNFKLKSRKSPSEKLKDEKRPWILRTRAASVQLESNVTQEESHVLPQTIIYISCGWESFKEDCTKLLSGKSWHLDKAQGFNFFPGTESIEILAVFKRGSGTTAKKKGKRKKSTTKEIRQTFY